MNPARRTDRRYRTMNDDRPDPNTSPPGREVDQFPVLIAGSSLIIHIAPHIIEDSETEDLSPTKPINQAANTSFIRPRSKSTGEVLSTRKAPMINVLTKGLENFVKLDDYDRKETRSGRRKRLQSTYMSPRVITEKSVWLRGSPVKKAKLDSTVQAPKEPKEKRPIQQPKKPKKTVKQPRKPAKPRKQIQLEPAVLPPAEILPAPPVAQRRYHDFGLAMDIFNSGIIEDWRSSQNVEGDSSYSFTRFPQAADFRRCTDQVYFCRLSPSVGLINIAAHSTRSESLTQEFSVVILTLSIVD